MRVSYSRYLGKVNVFFLCRILLKTITQKTDLEKR